MERSRRPARWLRPALALGLLAAWFGCGAPVPEERSSYVGVWQGEGVTLEIGADGQVRYRKDRDGVRTRIQAPLVGFEGDDFAVGVGCVVTRFEVSEPPHLEDGSWRMVVDGVELTREPGSGAGLSV